MKDNIEKRIGWIEKRVELSDMAKHYIAFQMQSYAEQYHEEQNVGSSYVGFSLPDAKQTVAEIYGKEDWKDVLRDYEYGLGISKIIGFEELMDKVAEVYRKN